jgi:hypothetical protein
VLGLNLLHAEDSSPVTLPTETILPQFFTCRFLSFLSLPILSPGSSVVIKTLNHGKHHMSTLRLAQASIQYSAINGRIERLGLTFIKKTRIYDICLQGESEHLNIAV